MNFEAKFSTGGILVGMGCEEVRQVVAKIGEQ